MSKICELVLFASSDKKIADAIMDVIDNENLFSNRRYEDSIWGPTEKRIDFLGRDIKRTIIVDQSDVAYLFNQS
jgi:TFIIF-interacting CTD phosphatase-like protein